MHLELKFNVKTSADLPTTCSFNNCNAESFCQGSVEKDVALNKYLIGQTKVISEAFIFHSHIWDYCSANISGHGSFRSKFEC